MLPFIVVSLFLTAVSCNDDDEQTEDLVGNWIDLGDYEGRPRTQAVGFSVGDKGYVGLGYNPNEEKERLIDFWEYDPELNTWNQKADFPGIPRNGAIGIGTDTKGYVGTGYGYNDTIKKFQQLKDFWEYDPGLNTWTQKAVFMGTARYGAVGFSINNKCYIGTGYDGYYLKDFYEYDPAGDTWTKKSSISGSKRNEAMGFALNGKGYVCGGIDNGSFESDFYEYDPGTGIWTEKNPIINASDEAFDDDYTSIKGTGKVAFALNGKGYIATGGEGSAGNTVWEYDPVNDLWKQKTSFEGTGRVDAVVFVIGERAYITTGNSSSYYFDDIWGFDPDGEYNEDD